jgi:hypothetical protein
MQKMNRIISFIFACILVIAFPLDVMATCREMYIQITGKIIRKNNYCNDHPVSDAFISVFINDDKDGSSAISKADGSFELKYIFNFYGGTSYKGYYVNGKLEELAGGDCNRRPSKVTIIVNATDHSPAKMEYEIKNLENNVNDHSAKIIFIKTPSITINKKDR